MLLHRCKCGILIPQELRLCPDCEAKESDKMSRHMEYNLNVENLFPLSNGNHGIISALYKKDEATKRQTQELLRNIIRQHWKGVGGIEKVLTGLD